MLHELLKNIVNHVCESLIIYFFLPCCFHHSNCSFFLCYLILRKLRYKMSMRTSKREKNNNDDEVKKKSKRHKKMKKSIFVSHSADASFDEKRLVADFVQQIKENNLAEDIWFDKDEQIINEPFWLSTRLEMVDKCRAVIVMLSKSYMSCPVTVYEAKIILGRRSAEDIANRPSIFCVILDHMNFPLSIAESLLSGNAVIIDLTTRDICNSSIEEKTSYAVGALSDKLEHVALIKSPFIPPNVSLNIHDPASWRKKQILHWSCNDVVEWLYSIQVREFYRQSFAELHVDGYLLLATTDTDLQFILGIDSKIVRKKITSELVHLLKHEQDHINNWHLKCRSLIPHANMVYLIYDPQDARIASKIKSNLTQRRLQILSHDNLGNSREEFLQLNGGLIAKCRHIMCLMTEAAAISPFIFHEISFCCWLGRNRSVVVLLFENIWNKLKPPMRAILGDFPAIDFENNLYSDCMDILEHHIKPPQILPGIVLEQTYLDKYNEGIQPMNRLCIKTCKKLEEMKLHKSATTPTVFISYQWDMQEKVLQIASYLNNHGLTCWSDVLASSFSNPIMSGFQSTDDQVDSFQTQIHSKMKSSTVVICCITPKYIICQNCEDDILLALNLGKPVLPVMLQFLPWPPEGTGERIRRLLVHLNRPIDLSNHKLFNVNLPLLLEKVLQCSI